MSDLSTVSTSSPAGRYDLLEHASQIDPAQAALSLHLGRGRRIALPDPTMELLVLPAPSPMSGDVQPDLRLLLAQGPLLLWQGERLLAGLTGIDPASTRDADGKWPQWLAAALAGRLQHTPLAALQSIAPPAPGEATTSAMVPLQWRLRDGQHAIETTAWASAALWRVLLEQAEPQRMPVSRWLPLAAASVVPLASHRLSRSAFDAVRVGDLILPDSPLFDIEGNGRLVLAARHWRVRYMDHQRLQLLSEENALNYETDPDAVQDEFQPDDYDEAAMAPAGGLDRAGYGDHDGDPLAADGLDADGSAQLGGQGEAQVPGEIRLTLRFELGRLKLSLDQLRALGEQTVLTLHDASAQSIAITSSGAEVGRGEVVSVDGRLGVRITRWSPAC